MMFIPSVHVNEHEREREREYSDNDLSNTSKGIQVSMDKGR